MSIVAIIIYWDIGTQDISFYKLAILSEKLSIIFCLELDWIRLLFSFTNVIIIPKCSV